MNIARKSKSLLTVVLILQVLAILIIQKPQHVYAQVVSPAFVQSNLSFTGNSVPSLSAGFTNQVTTGDTIVVAVSTWNGANSAIVSSITDNFGNTYSKTSEDPVPATSGSEPLSVWYA